MLGELPWLNPAKCQLVCLDNDDLSFRSGDKGVKFNPNSLPVSRTLGVTGEADNNVINPWGGLKLGSSANDTLSLELMFDATEDPEADLADKKGPLLKLYQLTMPLQPKPPGQARHPVVAFQWGSGFTFQGVVTKVTIAVKMFSSAGQFKRATVNMDIQGRAFQKIELDPIKFITKRTKLEKPKSKKGKKIEDKEYKKRAKALGGLS